MLNLHDIAGDVGVSDDTAKRWMKELEKSGIVFFLHPYSNNLLKRTIKTPKMYFFDTGLVSYLTRYSTPEILMNGAINGAILENYVVSEIIKTYSNSAQDCLLHYYRDKNSNEIDLIMESDGQLHPIEIKKKHQPAHTNHGRIQAALQGLRAERDRRDHLPSGDIERNRQQHIHCPCVDDLISFQKQIFYTQPLGFNEKSGGCFYRVCYPKNINEGGSQENIVLALEEYDLSDKQCKARYGALRSTASSYKGELTGSDMHLSFFWRESRMRSTFMCLNPPLTC